MNTLLITLLAAVVIVLLSLSLLGIGWLLTGKSRLRVGMCGRVPTQKRSKEKGCETDMTCGLCGKGAEKEENEDD